MSRVVGYGIDFGTTNSSISLAYEDRVEVLGIYPNSRDASSLPSLVYIHRNGNQASGSEAAQQFLVTGSARTQCDDCSLVHRDKEGRFSDCKQFDRAGGGCNDSRLASGIKSELSHLRIGQTHSWARDFTFAELAAIVLRDLKRRGDAKAGGDVRRVVVGHPIQFVGALGDDFEDAQRTAQERLVEASRLAGFTNATLYPEPAAAILDEPLDDGVAVSVDFGGGTFDVAVIEVVGGEGEVLALQGAGIGGERFDALLFDEYVHPLLGIDREPANGQRPIPHWFAEQLRTLGGVKHLLNNGRVPGLIDQIRRAGHREEAALLDALLFGGYAYDFYRSIEQAKIALSDASTSSIEFHRPRVDVSVPMERARFDQIIGVDLDVVMSQIDRALEKADVTAGEVGTVVRTGGSASIPAFIDRLADRFGSEKIKARPPLTSVAYGLGIIAQEEHFANA